MSPKGFRITPAAGPVHRLEASLRKFSYAPHRHDTYTLAITLEGVQSFTYRGARRQSLPGGLVVLHPDELHDGRAEDEQGFRYRSISLDPQLFQQILAGAELPFISNGVSSDPCLLKSVQPLLADLQRPLEQAAMDDAIYEIVTRMSELAGVRRRIKLADHRAAERAREFLLVAWDQPVSLEMLEQHAERDRWRLSRDFRVVFGTSPYRFLLMRRLQQAQALIAQGHALADVAARCLFADQSHMTRSFRKAFGITPRLWLQGQG